MRTRMRRRGFPMHAPPALAHSDEPAAGVGVSREIQPGRGIWMDGRFVHWDEATCHVLAFGLQYGTGVFEGIRAYRAKRGIALFRLADHVERLYRSAAAIMLNIPYSLDEFLEVIKGVVRTSDQGEVYIRPVAFYGYHHLGLNPLGNPVHTAVACWPARPYLGAESLRRGVRVRISSWRRIAPDALPPQIKATGSYLNSVLAKLDATRAGYDEALFLNHDGSICEGPAGNVFFVLGGMLVTPPPLKAGLAGLTRNSVIRLARELGFDVRESDLSRADAYAADEAFFTGTAAEVVPIREIDDRVIGPPGPITRTVWEQYSAATHGYLAEHEDWNDYV
jgi:branched-chain amino acid aminotransferase